MVQHQAPGEHLKKAGGELRDATVETGRAIGSAGSRAADTVADKLRGARDWVSEEWSLHISRPLNSSLVRERYHPALNASGGCLGAPDVVHETAHGDDYFRSAGDRVRDVRDNVRDAARDARETARDAARDVRDTARDGARDVRDGARDARDSVRDTARDVRDSVRDAASTARDRMRSAATTYSPSDEPRTTRDVQPLSVALAFGCTAGAAVVGALAAAPFERVSQLQQVEKELGTHVDGISGAFAHVHKDKSYWRGIEWTLAAETLSLASALWLPTLQTIAHRRGYTALEAPPAALAVTTFDDILATLIVHPLHVQGLLKATGATVPDDASAGQVAHGLSAATGGMVPVRNFRGIVPAFAGAAVFRTALVLLWAAASAVPGGATDTKRVAVYAAARAAAYPFNALARREAVGYTGSWADGLTFAGFLPHAAGVLVGGVASVAAAAVLGSLLG